jgi:hypothetical protein
MFVQIKDLVVNKNDLCWNKMKIIQEVIKNEWIYKDDIKKYYHKKNQVLLVKKKECIFEVFIHYNFIYRKWICNVKNTLT